MDDLAWLRDAILHWRDAGFPDDIITSALERTLKDYGNPTWVAANQSRIDELLADLRKGAA